MRDPQGRASGTLRPGGARSIHAEPRHPSRALLFEIGRDGSGVIVAEKRDPTLDRQLDIAWSNLKIQGTRYIQAKDIGSHIVGLNLRSKTDNVAGLQLADLVVSPIGRHVLGKPEKEDFHVVRQKLRTNSAGEYPGVGLVVLPK